MRAATGRSGSADSSKYMSPAWLATAENSSGWRIASASAPKPPDDLPPMARASRAGDGAEARVDRRDHLAHHVRLVVADRRRIEVLRAAPAREAVGRDDDRLAHPPARPAVEAVAQARLPRRAREQHLARPRVAGQPVDHRVAAVGRAPRTKAAARRRSAAPSRRRAGCPPARGCRRSRRRCSSRSARAPIAHAGDSGLHLRAEAIDHGVGPPSGPQRGARLAGPGDLDGVSVPSVRSVGVRRRASSRAGGRHPARIRPRRAAASVAAAAPSFAGSCGSPPRGPRTLR